MCDWTAAALLGEWRHRARPDLERLGAFDFRVSEDGSKAIIEMRSEAVVASITAWSTGMLEMISFATDKGPSSNPDVVTEQRETRSQAEALLDDWLMRLRGRVV